MKPGEVFAHGKYTLLRKLRASGMAEVWLARQHGTEGFAKDVVIKRILPHLAEDDKLVTMFLDEARIAANLNHPNVVQIFDLGNDGQDYFIAMEYIRGYDLEQIQEQLKQRHMSFPTEIGAKIIADTCLGLAYAHDCKAPDGTPMQVVHRDVSPQNVLVSETGVVKLIDFGIAKARTSSTRTQVGHTKGKICYMSPEQMMARDLDRRSDIFSAGVVMYEMLLGTKPFDGDNLLACFHKLMKEGITPPRQIRPDMSPHLESITMTALERDREDRYPTATALRYELQKYIDSEGVSLGPEHLADFLRWLFNPDDSTQVVFDLPRSQKKSSPQLATAASSVHSGFTPAPSPPPPAVNTARKFGTEDRLTVPSSSSQPYITGTSNTGQGPGLGPGFNEPGFIGGPTPLTGGIGSSPTLAIDHTGPQLGAALAFDDDLDEHAPYRPRRKRRGNGGGMVLYIIVFILLLGGGVAGAYFAGFLGDPATTPTPDPRIGGKKASLPTKGLPPVDRPKQAAVPEKRPQVPERPKPVAKRRTKPPKRRVKKRPKRPKVRPRRRPKRRPRCRVGYLILDIDKKIKRAKVNIDGTGYTSLPLLSRKKLRAGWHRFGFLWSGGFKSKSLKIRGCKVNKYFCNLDPGQIRCERE